MLPSFYTQLRRWRVRVQILAVLLGLGAALSFSVVCCRLARRGRLLNRGAHGAGAACSGALPPADSRSPYMVRDGSFRLRGGNPVQRVGGYPAPSEYDLRQVGNRFPVPRVLPNPRDGEIEPRSIPSFRVRAVGSVGRGGSGPRVAIDRL